MTEWRCPDCRAAYAAWLSRCPRCQSQEGLDVALNECADCTTRFAVGLKRCPHCASKNFHEEGSMPKITVHGGPSDATLPDDTEMPADAAPEPDEENTPVAEPDAGEEEAAPEGTPAVPSDEPDTEPKPEQDYETWTVEQLKDRLGERDLPKSGRRDDLVLRLLEDDDARAAQPEAK